MVASAITPVTVLTGFLGSGKTTLLNHLLADPRHADSAVIVNEWGAVPIDHALVRTASGNVIVLAGGCICCRVAGDLVRTLRELHHQRSAGTIAFRRVVIETTGLADPVPLLATLVEMPVVAARYALSGVVATVDAEHGMATLDAHDEAVKQVAMADRIVLTKEDRAPPEAIARLEARLARLNPGARRLRANHGDVAGFDLLEAGLYRGAAAAPDATGWLNAGAYRPAGRANAVTAHDARISSFAWRHAEPLAWEDLEPALEKLLDLYGSRVLRLKGLANIAGEAGPRAIHAVQHTLYPSARLPSWPDAGRATTLVFIGRDLEEAEVTPILESTWQQPKPRT